MDGKTLYAGFFARVNKVRRCLSRDSLFGQRTGFAILVHGFDLFVYGGFEVVDVFEGPAGEMNGFRLLQPNAISYAILMRFLR